MKASSFFTPEQQEVIIGAIAEAERATSGEIRVHIETKCHKKVLDRAAWVFNKLGMARTAERNGVLFYLAVADKKYAVIGDTGINSVVPPGFWDTIRDHMKEKFMEDKFTEGLSEGIIMAGNKLKDQFPCAPDDVNELQNIISFDNEETGESI